MILRRKLVDVRMLPENEFDDLVERALRRIPPRFRKHLRNVAVIVEREYRTPWVHQSYIEPQVCAATVDALGQVVVYASTQAMFRTRDFRISS